MAVTGGPAGRESGGTAPLTEPAGGRAPGYAVVLPVRDEEESLAAVLEELEAVLAGENVAIAVGLNGCTDGSKAVLDARGALYRETERPGYGYGCLAAIEAARESGFPLAAWIFYAADGANDPRDIPRLIARHRGGAEMVLGSRTLRPHNWKTMGPGLVAGNGVLAAVASLMARRVFTDLGPLRLIGADLFERLDLREMTYGWTVEAQVRAARLGARIEEIPVNDRPRMAGRQKVSGLGWKHSWRVARCIMQAAIRAARREV
ncbi:MAG TPA: glycosyltransferase family 2 protein [Verrucomicrobiales bacterium]|nr:glycosyltransferase family 2 protein [Verrucomicrobiales bacterium]